MPARTCLNIEELSGVCNVDVDFIIELTQRNFLKPSRCEGKSYYGSKDKLRLEVIVKGLDLGFSLKEIEMLIANQAPLFDGGQA